MVAIVAVRLVVVLHVRVGVQVLPVGEQLGKTQGAVDLVGVEPDDVGTEWDSDHSIATCVGTASLAHMFLLGNF